MSRGEGIHSDLQKVSLEHWTFGEPGWGWGICILRIYRIDSAQYFHVRSNAGVIILKTNA